MISYSLCVLDIISSISWAWWHKKITTSFLPKFRIFPKTFSGLWAEQFHFRDLNWCWHSRIDFLAPPAMYGTSSGNRLDSFICLWVKAFTWFGGKSCMLWLFAVKSKPMFLRREKKETLIKNQLLNKVKRLRFGVIQKRESSWFLKVPIWFVKSLKAVLS